MFKLFLFAIASVFVLEGNADTSEKQPLRIASWNVNNLAEIGVQAQSRGPLRTQDDFQVLNAYAKSLNADVVALQEVSSLSALSRVFPKEQYQLYLSPRKSVEVSSKKYPGIYTAYAVKKALASRVKVSPYALLGIGGVRWGLELVLTGDNKLSLLNVHLKSGCAYGSLNNIRRKQCETLQQQITPLERWIDKKVGKKEAFLVLGDFNRAFDKYSQRDHFWKEIDDDEPKGMDLLRLPYKQGNRCWEGSENHHSYPVDFFVFDKTLLPLTREAYEQFDFNEAQRDEERKLPSDHCAAVLEINL
ncbi:MAG: endonuclease/exonuclease/phosphatase family protein [Cellvibrionaceae bacterium]